MPLNVDTKIFIGIATGILVTCVSASWFYYDVYFRSKPKKAPDLDASLQKIKRRAIERCRNNNISPTTRNIITLPEFESAEDVQQYFLQQVTLGEDNINKGNYDEAAENFANAVIVCLEENELMTILKKTLHPEVYRLLQSKLDMANLSSLEQ